MYQMHSLCAMKEVQLSL